MEQRFPKNTGMLEIETDSGIINGNLDVPEPVNGIIIFAHGSGSSRLSPRNQYVAHHFQKENFGTFLIDLLTDKEQEHEHQTGESLFDLLLISERIISATEWLSKHSETADIPIGYFGASTGAAAVLSAASKNSGAVKAIVSRGGRPDIAPSVLPEITVPTLFIAGEKDTYVIELNRRAMELMPGEKQLAIVPGAGHLFEEPGALDEFSKLAVQWYSDHL